MEQMESKRKIILGFILLAIALVSSFYVPIDYYLHIIDLMKTLLVGL
jgi:hypothetical protein